MKAYLQSEPLRPLRSSLIHTLLKLQHIVKHNQVGKNVSLQLNVFAQTAPSFHHVLSSKRKISAIIESQPIHRKTELSATILKGGLVINTVPIGYDNALSL